jgi:hypothetical protein
LGHRPGDGVDDEDDPTEGGKNDPGEPEHENVPKQRHDPNFEREHRARRSGEPPVSREAGDSDKGSGESTNDSSPSEGSSPSDDSPSSEGSE